MAKQTINLGVSDNDGTGDTLKVGGDKINDNFTELYYLFPSMASTGFIGNTTATTISVTGTYYVITGTYVETSTTSDMTTDAAGKMTYTGAIDKHFHIVSNFDITTEVNNQTIAFQWFKNGVAVSPLIESRVGTSTDIGTATLHADTMMSTNDYLELKVANETTSANVTIKNIYKFAMGMKML